MEFNNKQKLYIRKKYRKLNKIEIAKRLGVNVDSVNRYLSQRIKDEKVKKNSFLWIEKLDEKKMIKIKNFSFKRFWNKNKYIYLGLTILIVLIFINSLDNEFLSDDIAGIVMNENIGKFENIFSSISIVQNLFYFLIVNIFGKSFFWFRLINNIIPHLFMVWGIYILVSMLLNKKVAFFTSVLMAIHPIVVESVVWISAGLHARYSALVVWGLIFYVVSLKKEKNIWISLLLLILSVLSAEKAIMFPGLLLLLWICFGILNTNWKKIFIFLGMPTIGLGLIYISKMGDRLFSLKNDFYGGGGMTNPLLQIPVAISSYLGLIFWPDKLTLYHSELNFSWLGISLIYLGFFVYLGFLIWGFLKNKKVFFGLAWFVIALSPTLTPFGVSWVVAERYVYLASVGIFMLIGLGIAKISENKKYQSNLYAVLSLILVALIIRTVIRNNDWQNQDNLWLAAERTSPSSQQNHNNLGDLYGRRGDYERAIYHFSKAIELNPYYGDAYHNLGNIYWQVGMVDEAKAAYEKVLEINPRVWQTYQNLGSIYMNTGEKEKALEYLRKAYDINPGNEELLRVIKELETGR